MTSYISGMVFPIRQLRCRSFTVSNAGVCQADSMISDMGLANVLLMECPPRRGDKVGKGSGTAPPQFTCHSGRSLLLIFLIGDGPSQTKMGNVLRRASAWMLQRQNVSVVKAPSCLRRRVRRDLLRSFRITAGTRLGEASWGSVEEVPACADITGHLL